MDGLSISMMCVHKTGETEKALSLSAYGESGAGIG